MDNFFPSGAIGSSFWTLIVELRHYLYPPMRWRRCELFRFYKNGQKLLKWPQMTAKKYLRKHSFSFLKFIIFVGLERKYEFHGSIAIHIICNICIKKSAIGTYNMLHTFIYDSLSKIAYLVEITDLVKFVRYRWFLVFE